MKLGITSDCWHETKVVEATDAVKDAGYEKALLGGDYGPGLEKIFIVCMCRYRNDEEIFKRRIRLDHKRLILYIDVFLNYDLMIKGPTAKRIDHLVRKLYAEIPPIVEKYKLKGFDTKRLVADYRAFLAGTGLASGPLG